MRNIPFKLRLIPIALAGALVIPMTSYAADGDDKSNDEKRVTITGSHIKRSDLETPSPIQVIDREAIVGSGLTTLQQLVEKLPAAGAGSFSTRGNSQDSTGNGGAAISLRGFGADATLVLINGRRAGISPFAESVVNNFVDINSIPLSAIERIDIMKDGASAVYGSDAVAGVINIILRKDFNGSEVTVGYGSTTKSSSDEKSINAIFGFSDEKSSATLIFDYFGTTELRNADRGRLGSANQEANGGFDLRSSRGFPGRYILDGDTGPTIDPNCPADRAFGSTCVFDYGPYGFLIPNMERVGSMFLYNTEVAQDMQLFFEISAQRNTSQAGGAPTPLDGDAGLTVPGTHPDNPFGVDLAIDRHRTVDAGPRVWDIESQSLRFVTGLNGSFNDFDWEMSFTKASGLSLQTGDRSQGWVRTDFLQNEINAGRYNPFGGTINPPEVIDAITTSLTRKGTSGLTAFEGNLSGPIMTMDSGDVEMAVGYEYREESVKDIPDDQFQRGLIFGTESVSAEASRSHWSFYTEFAIPVTETLEMQLAGRYDDYEGAGTSTNPKIGFNWKMNEDMALRASWGTGFRAPSLAQIGLGPSQESRFFTDPYCADTPDPSACNSGATDLTINFSGNPELKPEETESYNVGMIWDITRDFNMSLDYWNIVQDGKIDEQDIGAIANEACVVGLNDPRCVRNANGQLTAINTTYDNLDNQKASGIDITANYKMDMADFGDLKLRLDWTYMTNFEKTETCDPSAGTTISAECLKNNGHYTRDWTGEYEYPQIRWNASAEWNVGAWTTTAILNYIGEFHDLPDSDLDGTVDFEFNDTPTVDAWYTLDVQTTYEMTKNFDLTFGVNNLLDKDVPFAIGDGNNDLYGYVQGVHDPRGQFVYTKATFRF